MRTNFPKRPGQVNLIKVTFLPPELALAMKDKAGRKYIWVREDSPLVQDRYICQDMMDYIDGQYPDRVITITNAVEVDRAPIEDRHRKSLARYIRRGLSPEEVPMVIVAYGFLKDPDLSELVAEVIQADLVA